MKFAYAAAVAAVIVSMTAFTGCDKKEEAPADGAKAAEQAPAAKPVAK